MKMKGKVFVITRWGRVLRFIFRGNFRYCSMVAFYLGKLFPKLRDIYTERPTILKSEEAPVTRFMETYGIHDVDFAEKISGHIAYMRGKFPGMSSDRVLRKTAEYYRLKVMGK